MQRFIKILQVFCFFLLLNNTPNCFSQSNFHFKKLNHKKEKISFKLINNLIVIPLKINGVKLSFILDSGSDKTILFKLYENDSVGLKNPQKVKLRGLGVGEPVNALISKKNTIEIEGIESNNHTVFVILKDFFDLSSKMGTTIHGIIGYSFFKDFIVHINYKKKYIKLYNRAHYEKKICKKCEKFPLRFFRRKPYLRTKVQLDTVKNKLVDLKLLIDSGSSDAIWLFEGTHKKIVTPKKHFKDILGEGLSGLILGNRARVDKLKIGNFSIEQPAVAFLDSTSTHIARNYKLRNGSIGGNILKRFEIWLDYRGKNIVLKKNGSFKKGFNYNMSGIDIVYSGKRLIKEEVQRKKRSEFGHEISESNSIFLDKRYVFKFKPSVKINTISSNSPADIAGLKVDDVLLELNGKPIHQFNIEEILYKFREKENKKMSITVLRGNKKLKFKFRLERRI